MTIVDNIILSITPRSYDKAADIRARQNKYNGEDSASIRSPGAKGIFNSLNAKDKSIAALDDDQKYEATGRTSLWSSIKGGRSFVDDGSKVFPWLFASDSHGTQMANLICAMDPFCELYVARVAEGKYSITLNRAARVSVSFMPPELLIKSSKIVLTLL